MSAEKRPIHKLIERKAMEQIMFGFIQGVKFNFAGISIERAIDMFKKKFNITDDELSTASARTTYVRMTKEFHDFLKTDNGQKETEM